MKGVISVLVVLSCLIAFTVAYTTSGNKILDPNGNPILLRGVARPSLEWSAVGEGLGLADYQLIKDWGANVVRLSLSQCFWLTGMSEYNSNYQSVVDQQVRWIKGLGMGVILDLHWSNKGSSTTKCGQQRMADSHSSTFWTQVATKYKNDPWVAFELYNEPFNIEWNIAKDGGDTGDGYRTPGFQSLYNTVRATGALNLVIIGGTYWAYDLSKVGSNPVSGVNIAYCSHPYDTTDRLSSGWMNMFGYLAATYPVVMTEFGGFDCGTRYVSDLIAFADANCISWMGWGWFPGGCTFPGLITKWDGTPSPPGLLVKNALTIGSKIPRCGSVITPTASPTRPPTLRPTTGTATPAPTTAPTVRPSTTGGVSPNTIPVYSDRALAPFIDWSWATTRNAADAYAPNSGSASYSFAPSNWGSVYFYKAGGINTNLHASIEFYVNVRSGGQLWNFNMVRYNGTHSNKIGNDWPVARYCPSNPITPNSWVKCTALLSSFPAGLYDGFWFTDQSGRSQSLVYVDDVTVIGK